MRRVVGVQALLQRLTRPLDDVRFGVERVHPDLAAVLVVVDLRAGQTVHVGHLIALEVAKHVIERAVLHHHDDDVLERAQPRKLIRVHRHHERLPVGWSRRSSLTGTTNRPPFVWSGRSPPPHPPGPPRAPPAPTAPLRAPATPSHATGTPSNR